MHGDGDTHTNTHTYAREMPNGRPRFLPSGSRVQGSERPGPGRGRGGGTELPDELQTPTAGTRSPRPGGGPPPPRSLPPRLSGRWLGARGAPGRSSPVGKGTREAAASPRGTPAPRSNPAPPGSRLGPRRVRAPGARGRRGEGPPGPTAPPGPPPPSLPPSVRPSRGNSALGDPPGARGPALRREPPAAAAAGARRRPPPGPRPLTPRSRGCPPAPSRACPSRLAPRPAGGRHRAGAWLHRSARLALPLALGLRRPAAPPALYFRGRGVTSRPRPPPGQPIPAASPLKGRCQAAEALAWGPPRRGACGDAALVFRGQRGGALGTPAALRARGACGFPRSARAARSCLPQGGAAPRGDLPVFYSRGDGFCVFSPARGPQRGRTSEGRCGVAADKGGQRDSARGLRGHPGQRATAWESEGRRGTAWGRGGRRGRTADASPGRAGGECQPPPL